MAQNYLVADRDVYLDKDGKVAEKPEDVRSLLVKKGCTIPTERARELGLELPDYQPAAVPQRTMCYVNGDGTVSVGGKTYVDKDVAPVPLPAEIPEGSVLAVLSEDKASARIGDGVYHFDDTLEQKLRDMSQELDTANATIVELRKQVPAEVPVIGKSPAAGK